MKSLSLQRPLVLLVVGAPGSGKSFFARQFAEMFNAPLVSFDEIHYRLFTNPTHKPEETSIVTDVMKIIATQIVKTQKVFVVDGGVNPRKERLEFQQLAKTDGYDSLIIWVQTDQETAHIRATKRDGRRSGDTFNHSLNEQQFISLAKKMTPPHKNEAVVVISGKHTFSSQAKAVLKKLVAPRDNGVIKPVERVDNQLNSSSSSSSRRTIILS